jgi:hypothetical protein
LFFGVKKLTLDYLADFVDLNDKPTAEDRIQGLGRNCTIFDLTRFWAYKAVLPYLESKSSYQAWFNAVLERVMKENEQFPEPLQYAEIKQISKSIAKWVWQRFSIEGRRNGTLKKVLRVVASLKVVVDLHLRPWKN